MFTKCAVQQVGGGRRTVVALLCGAGSATRMPLGSVESNCADVALRRRVAAICGRLRAQQCGRYIDSPASRHAAPPVQLLILCLSPDRDRNALNDKTQPTMTKDKLFVLFQTVMTVEQHTLLLHLMYRLYLYDKQIHRSIYSRILYSQHIVLDLKEPAI